MGFRRRRGADRPEALLAVGGDRRPAAADAGRAGRCAVLRRLGDPGAAAPAERRAVDAPPATIGLAAMLSVPAGSIRMAISCRSTPRSTPTVLVGAAVPGLFSTATAMVVYFRLIRIAGPSFTSQLNYLIPLWAVAIGVLFLGEEPTLNHLAGLVLILGGMLWSRRRGERPAIRSRSAAIQFRFGCPPRLTRTDP
jgi:drug/metabolite transporter (DMT)-like permease